MGFFVPDVGRSPADGKPIKEIPRKQVDLRGIGAINARVLDLHATKYDS